MTRALHQPVDAESRLLLYAVSELPPRDAAELEDQLRRDPDLRRRLEATRDAAKFAADVLERADAGRPPSGVSRAAARAARAVAAWQDAPAVAGQIGPEPAGPLAQGRVWKIARWPLSAAAALVVGLIVWTFASDPSTVGPANVAFNLPYDRPNNYAFDPANPGRRPERRWGERLSRQRDVETSPRPDAPQPAQAGDLASAAERAAMLFEDPAGRWGEPANAGNSAGTGDALMAGLTLGDEYGARLAALRRVADDDWAGEDW